MHWIINNFIWKELQQFQRFGISFLFQLEILRLRNYSRRHFIYLTTTCLLDSAFINLLKTLKYSAKYHNALKNQEMYMDALSQGSKLLKELKKLDDKNLLVEVGIFSYCKQEPRMFTRNEADIMKELKTFNKT